MKKVIKALAFASIAFATPVWAANPIEPSGQTSDKNPGAAPSEVQASPQTDNQNVPGGTPNTPDPTKNTPGANSKS
jgi:hypothetical protein